MNLLITGFGLPTNAVPEETPLNIKVNLNDVLKITCISIVKTIRLALGSYRRASLAQEKKEPTDDTGTDVYSQFNLNMFWA